MSFVPHWIGAALYVVAAATAPVAQSDSTQHELVGGAQLASEETRDGLVSSQDDPAAIVSASGRAYAVGRTRAAGFARALVVASDVATGATLWTSELGEDDSEGKAAALSPDESVLFVAGTTASPPDFEADAVSFAVDTATGSVLWSSRFALPSGHRADVVAVDHGADPASPRVFVALTDRAPAFSDWDVRVLAYDAATGAPLWDDVYDGSDSLADRAVDLEAFPDGTRVFVALTSAATATGDDYVTLAYDAATGARDWTRRHTGAGAGASSADSPRDLAVVANANLLVVTGAARSTDETVAYTLLGGVLWTAPFADEGEAIAVSPVGFDMYVSGVRRGVSAGDDDAVTVAYNAFTGAVRWTAAFDSGVDDDRPVAGAVSTDGGRYFLTGTRILSNTSTNQFTVAYESFFGGEQWRGELDGGGAQRDDAKALAVDPATGRVVAAGSSARPGRATDVALVAYEPATGAEAFTTLVDKVAGGADDVRDLAAGAQGLRLYTTASAGFFGTWCDTTAWSTATGAELWTARFPTSDGFIGGGERVVVDPDEARLAVLARADDGAHLVGYRASDGLELWRVVRDDYAGDATGELALSPDGAVLFVTHASGAAPAALDWEVLALDMASGALLWEETFDAAGLVDRPHDLVVSPGGDRVWVAGTSAIPGVGGEDVFVIGYDAASGATDWTARPAGPLVLGLGLEESATAIARSPGGQKLFVGARVIDAAQVESYRVVALRAGDGVQLWSTSSLPAEALVDLASSLDGGLVLVASHTAPDDPESSDAVVTAFDAATGVEAWRAVFDDGAGDRFRGLALDPDGVTLYVTGLRDAGAGFAGVVGGDVHTHALDVDTGARLWSAAFDGAGFDGAAGSGLGDDQGAAVACDGTTVWVAARSDGGISATDTTLLGYARPRLAAGPAEVGFVSGGAHALHLRGDAPRATWVYWMFGSATGSSPGQVLTSGAVLPLVPDMYFDITVKKPLATVFENYLGMLDADGRATARLVVPAQSDPALAGMTLYHAYLAAPTAGGFDFASNAVEVRLDP